MLSRRLRTMKYVLSGKNHSFIKEFEVSVCHSGNIELQTPCLWAPSGTSQSTILERACNLTEIFLLAQIAQATSNQMSRRDRLRPYMDVIDDMLAEMVSPFHLSFVAFDLGLLSWGLRDLGDNETCSSRLRIYIRMGLRASQVTYYSVCACHLLGSLVAVMIPG